MRAACLVPHTRRRHGMTVEEGRRHCFYLDSRGLVCASRTNLQHHKQPFAHDVEFCPDLLTAIRALKPTALVGVSTIAKSFNRRERGGGEGCVRGWPRVLLWHGMRMRVSCTHVTPLRAHRPIGSHAPANADAPTHNAQGGGGRDVRAQRPPHHLPAEQPDQQVRVQL
jgi:hypothetical protein